jgi:hypothetical protein
MDWKQQKIKAIEEVENIYFYDKNVKITYKAVPLACITGSRYFNAYVGWTWQYMRNNLKRKDVTETNCNDWIDYPEENGVDELVYEQFGNEYFIVNGHHRTCIAKFMGRQTVFVQVQEHFFDRDLFSLWRQLSRHFIKVELQDSISNPTWRVSMPPYTITLRGASAIYSFCQYYELLAPALWEAILLQLPRFRRWVISDTTYYYWDVYKIDPALRWALLMHKKNVS